MCARVGNRWGGSQGLRCHVPQVLGCVARRGGGAELDAPRCENLQSGTCSCSPAPPGTYLEV